MTYQETEDFKNRKEKLAEIRKLGIEPYPHKFDQTTTPLEISEKNKEKDVGSFEEADLGHTENVKVAGRLILFRAMGKNAFAHIQDGGAKIQVMFNRDKTEVVGFTPTPELSHIKFIEKKIDLGDFLGVEGHLFRTQKGELTIFVKKMTLLAKSLLPLPEKHAGLVDKEMRYRKRWLDLISHEEVRNTFKLRSLIIHHIRNFLANEGYLEVETPALQNIYGGAAARPFTTHLNALDENMFLRISLEISLKKLVVGGMEKIFELSKVFRNEGIDKTHNPEFTMLEAYAAYMDYHDLMALVENMVQSLAVKLFGKTALPYTINGEEVLIEYKAPWKRISMKDAIKEYAGIDVDSLSDSDLKRYLEEECNLDPKFLASCPRGILIACLFEEKVEDKLIQPHHIIDHPIETTPLCKPHRDPTKRQEGLVERFETFIAGKELCNAYSELNDPEIQRALLEDQAKKRDGGDEEAHPLDEEFIEAICQGMPPTGGFGIGIDRLTMLLTNTPTIRDVIYFPMMKLST